MFNPVVSLKNVSVNHNSQRILRNINLDILRGGHLAVIGKSGSGKSVLLKVIAGLRAINVGTISYNFMCGITSKGIAYIDARHHFKNNSNTTDLYYQQRFNSFDADDSPTVTDHLCKIADETPPGYWTIEKVIDRLDIKCVYDKELIKLSNGETKRLRLASALLKNPELLLLDQPLTGLDIEARRSFNVLLNEIAVSGITVLMATSPNEIPDIIDKVLLLNEGEIIDIVPANSFTAAAFEEANSDVSIDSNEIGNLLNNISVYSTFIKMTNVNVRYGDKTILKNINWEVRQGEHWALLGHNGAGKSTLLSLIYGDNPQAYANDIVLFDKQRGTGESIWDIKKKCGFVSPELFQYFPTDNSCVQVVESGFYDTLGLFRKSEPSRAAQSLKWMEVFKIENYRDQSLKNIPASAQRLCLLARALVKNPDLLILDEPCQGMDDEQKALFRNIMNTICEQSNLTLIYVTHYMEELPDVVDRYMKLEKGEVIS